MIQDLKEEKQRPGGSRKRTTRWDRREGHQRTREDRGSRIGGKKCENGGSWMEGWRREEGWKRAGEDEGWAGGRQRIRGSKGRRKGGRGLKKGRGGEGGGLGEDERSEGGGLMEDGGELVGRKESWGIGGRRTRA